ncbi:MAG: radical SAM family heme chaperone HemW [Flavobacteriaceae bacterium]|nr:radical SAM family heme chaperone HemW [Flavobacteriaceae bacterium]MCY4217372.1 radical SAM family heme chaperone HemW [Flavobacteriaceae bacterium]MCY4254436.1 radical SAM family heme chaperone HemW [Flavobacteriaceae bacterium]
MASLYFHYPFCKKACTYCNYHFSTSTSNHQTIIDALIKELELRKLEINKPINTIYFGGGTPSLMSVFQIRQVLNKVFQLFCVDSDAEITFEANPDDISKKYLCELQQLGINRLSLGIQSFNNKELKTIGRIHDGKTALDSLKLVTNQFENFSIDLIYGLVHSTIESWKVNLTKALDYSPKHLSLYILTIEENTLLHHQISHGKIKLPEEKVIFDQYNHGVDYLETNGYMHYEISSFSLPRWKSQHNTSYWNNKPYWGFGPAAHSFDGKKTRSWNIENNHLYLKSIHQGKLPKKEEVLTEIDRYNEYLMISLRTSQGIDLNRITTQWGKHYQTSLLHKASRYIKQKLMNQSQCRLKLTKHGKILADRIVSDLFLESKPVERV